MDSGELCVMMGSVKMKLTLFADSWDTTVQTDMIISQICEKMCQILCLHWLTSGIHALQFTVIDINAFMHTTFAALHAQTAALKLKQVVDLFLNECLIRCRHQHETGQAVLCSIVFSL